MIPNVQQFISGVAKDFLVRPTGYSPGKIGIGGFLFDIIAQEESTVEAETTDHYVENNYAIQDHIAVRPEMFTLKGFMGELNDISINQGLGILTSIQSLGTIGGLAPNFAAQATQTYAKITAVTSKVNSVINQANNVFGMFKNKSTTTSKAQEAFSLFRNLCINRILCTVETPFKVYTDMMIVRVSAINREDTKIVSDFTITFKQIRTAQVTYESSKPKALSGRAAAMIAPSVSKGQVVGKSIIDVNILNVTRYPGVNVLTGGI